MNCLLQRLALLFLLVGQAHAAVPSTITPEDLQLIGGYRFPQRVGVKGNGGSNAIGFPRGGCEVQTLDGVTTAWADNGEQSRQVLSFTSTAPMGTNANPAKWPVMNGSKWWSMNQLYEGSVVSDGFMIPSGLGYDRRTNHVYVAARSRYNTRKDHSQWVARVKWPSGEVDQDFKPNYLAQNAYLAGKYSGGVGMIPTWFADKYTGGERLALIGGGMSGGQHGGAGPALALFDENEVKPIFSFATTAEVGRDAAAKPPWSMGTKKRVERGPANYGPVGIGWAHAPDETGGYWANANIRGSGCWVDTEQFSSLMYLSRRPAGEIDYALQVECLCKTKQVWLYVYDPADVAEAAMGTIAPYSIRGKFYPWPSGLPGVARSLSWDEESQTLWVYFARAIPSGVESYPIIAAYKLIERGSPDQSPDTDH